MPVSSVQGRDDNDDQEPVRARSKESSPSVNNTDDRNKSDKHDEAKKKPGERDIDHRRKKRTSGGRKSRRGLKASTTRSSSRRMLLVDDDDDGGVLSKNREPPASNPPASNPSNRSLSLNSSNSSKHREPPAFNPRNRRLSLNSNSSKHREPSPLSTSNRSLSLNSCSSTNNSSMQSQSHWSQASSNRSVNSSFYSSFYSNSSNRHGGDGDGKKKSYSIDDFISDIEDDGEGNDSAVDIPVVINNGERKLQSSVISTTPSTHRRHSTYSRDRSRRESRKKNRDDPNASRNKIRRHRSSSKNGDLGLGGESSHYKLEGVYSNQRSSQSEIKKAENGESEEEELAKLTTDSKDKDAKNRRRLHRQSSSKDQFATTKSKIKEERPRSQRGIGRMKSASSGDLLGTPSGDIEKRRSRSNDRQIKRGSGVNNLSAESQEGVKKLFGATTQSSEEDTIVASSTNQKSLTEIETSTPEDRLPSIKSAKDSLNDSEKKNEKLESPSQNSGKAERGRRRIMELTKARSSIDNSTRKDRNTNRTSSRSDRKSSRRSKRDKESYRKDHRATKSNLRNDSIKKKDVDSMMDTNNTKSTNFSSVEECLPGSEKDADRIATDKSSSDKTKNPISLTDLFSNNEQYAKKGTILPPSLASEDEDQKKKKVIKKTSRKMATKISTTSVFNPRL